MRPKQHRLTGRFALMTVVALLAIGVAMVFSAGVSFAINFNKAEFREATYYEDRLNNLCVGVEHEEGFPIGDLFGGNCRWEGMEGAGNVGIGLTTLSSDTTGEGNIAAGREALALNTTGSENVVTGIFSMTTNTSGQRNVEDGSGSGLRENTAGNGNVAFGPSALEQNKTGSDNTALGKHAGELNGATGSNSVDIASQGATGDSGAIRIGSEGTQTKTFIAGIAGVTGLTGCGVEITSAGQLFCGAASQGVTGPTGPTGPEGKQGKEGKEGKEGPTGAEGKEGEAGATGATGATRGSAGPTGAAGASGATGNTGASGRQGVSGATGPTGSTGATGATGADGASFEFSTGGIPLANKGFVGRGVINETEAMVQQSVAPSGTLKKMTCFQDGTSSVAVTYTLRKNAAGTTLTCTIAAGSRRGVGTGRVAYASGDVLDIATPGRRTPGTPGSFSVSTG